ncbi:MAG TPA: type I restriction endonuclease [Bryobacteraceae bacterium]|nr:type I restriction endonuclease [Bryobacteraceae bacterium]
MSLEKIKTTTDQIVSRLPLVRGRGEEATKQALILPMLDALGYDIWNPAEVCPEYEADFAIKKGGQKEKVDLAIIIDGQPRIYFEVKSADTLLDGHHGQLARYFNATQSVSLAVLTNGIEYWFYTDTGDVNVMDQTPFYALKLDALDQALDILGRFHKSVFSPEAIRDFATELNYTAKMVTFLRAELDLRDRDPSENLVRWILAGERMYDGRVTANVVERFCPITKSALQIVLRDIVRRSVAALDKEVAAPARTPESQYEAASVPSADDCAQAESDLDVALQDPQRARVITTEQELACFAVIKEQFEHSPLAKALIFDATAKKDVLAQVAYKDTSGYFGIYLNKPSWWALRIVIGARVPWVGFNVMPEVGAQHLPAGYRRLDGGSLAEFRVAISGPEDLRGLNRVILAAFQKTIDDRRSGRDLMQAATAN